MAQVGMLNAYWKHRVYTSTAYRYSREDWSEDENLLAYGKDMSQSGLGYNLVVEAKLEASSLPESEFRQKLYDTSRLIDHKFLNEDLDEFKTGAVTLERIALFLKSQLGVPGAEVKVTENNRCSVETLADQSLVLTVFESLSAVHKHWNESLNESQNKELYGKCSGLHGHEYNIEVSVAGDMDQETGLLSSREYLKSRIHETVVLPLDGSYLNEHLGNTSGEKIALEVLRRVKNSGVAQQIHRVVVRETLKNSFVVGASLF